MIRDFAGNQDLLRRIETMASSGRIPHAVIIEGEEGLGRTTLAGLIARAAVCTGDEPPCGQCRECRLAMGAGHPDIEVITPEKASFGVGIVRGLRSRLFIMPHQAPRRVVILKNGELMTHAAQNALLKTLEEPPRSVVLIIIATSAGLMLPTVRSRCTIFSLAPPGHGEALSLLTARGIEPSAAEQALVLAGDNIGRALKFLNNKKLMEAVQNAQKLLYLIDEDKTFEAIKLIRPLEKDRAAAAEFLKELRQVISDQIHKRIVSGAGDYSFSPDKLTDMNEAVFEAERRLSAGVGRTVMFAVLLERLFSTLAK